MLHNVLYAQYVMSQRSGHFHDRQDFSDNLLSPFLPPVFQGREVGGKKRNLCFQLLTHPFFCRSGQHAAGDDPRLPGGGLHRREPPPALNQVLLQLHSRFLNWET